MQKQLAEKRLVASIAALALAWAQTSPVFAQKPGPTGNKFALTIENIMRGPNLYGYEPTSVRWSGDSRHIYFQWKQASDSIDQPFDTYVVDRDGSGLRKLSEIEARLSPPAFGSRTRDRKKMVYAMDGDLFLYDFSTDQRRQLTKTEEAESNPTFTQDEKHVAYTRGGNLYIMSLEDGMVEQMTDIVPAAPAGGAAPAAGGGGRGGRGGRGGGPPTATGSSAETKGTDSQEFLKKQEKELLEIVRERATLREQADARRKKDHPRKPFQLQARQSANRLELCPDEKCVIAMVTDGASGAKPDNVPNFITESAYTEDIPGRTAVGDTQNHQRAAILDVATGDVTWIDAGLGTRQIQMQPPLWNEQGTHAIMVAHATDNKDRWILALDPATGKTRTLFTEHDDAWLDGPGAQTLGWLQDGETIYFENERSGYAQLYSVNLAGGEPKQLTSGKFEVASVELSNDGTQFYLTTSEIDPGERHFYSMSITGGARTKITTQSGWHKATLSPDEKYIADVYSYTNKPPELFIGDNQPGASMKKLTSSPAKDFWDYPWLDVPEIKVPARDGAMIPAHFYKPPNYRRGGPAVVFVHGAGYAQNVGHFWSPNYSHEYLFHHFLMQHGYMVLDMDYRASAGYGRDWRTAIYRHMGGKDLDDNVDGAKWLVAQGADPKRIGIYGGSYGGFITLMAMFTTPDVFAAGAALRPVTDWAHYNNGYTSNILNLPQKDEEAYRKSSPIYFADGLKGALLICHGMVDTNVFFQDSVRLVQRLIELHKDNWSIAPYPVENHGFLQPSSWTDEYKRIFQLFETNLRK
ncbi:MAG TPA: prolyl oligopeptidase family serine peptidase [Bryobacteraceae bacterium]|nr:prolyl oligopeptidase family serine peptidase [Bryobacteraceae bacterium]